MGALVATPGAWVFGAGLRAAVLGSMSRDWPSIRGRITESGVDETSKGARLLVRYAYEVGGQAHVGATLGFASPGSRWISNSRRDEVHTSAQRYATGREVDVSYWTAHPSVSVLEPGFHRTSLTLIAIGAVICSLAFLR